MQVLRYIILSAKEGNVLSISNDWITADVEETDMRKKNIEELTKSLWD